MRKLLIVIAFILLFTVLYFVCTLIRPTIFNFSICEAFMLVRTEYNYGGSEINKYSEKYNMPASYLKALIILECSGKRNIKHRYEPSVFEKLKEVRDGTRHAYGSINQSTIVDASDEALKNLAKSWGPFQLMGYQCIELGVKVNDIRGENALEWCVVWMNKRYGAELRAGEFRDAFHIHNTGRPYPSNGPPQTHDPKYVEKGISYIRYYNDDGINIPFI